MSHTLAPSPAPTPGPSTAPSPGTPRTRLPSDPRSLAKYLRLAQLSSLQETYFKSITTDTDLFAYVRWSKSSAPEGPDRRARADEAASHQAGGASRPALGLPGPGAGTGVDGGLSSSSAEVGADGDRPAKRIKLGGQTEATKVDSAHAYSLRPAPDMTQSADSYYHGPHHPPPAHALRLLLDASQGPGMFDPEGVRVSALLAAANAAFAVAQGGVPGTVLPGPLPPGGAATADAAREREEQEEDWERAVVAALSTACAAKIAQGRDKLPLAKRLPPPSITHPQPVAQPSLGPVPPGQAQPGPPGHPQHHNAALAGQPGTSGHAPALGHHPSHPHGLPTQQQQQQGPPQHAPGYGDAYGGQAYWRGNYGER